MLQKHCGETDWRHSGQERKSQAAAVSPRTSILILDSASAIIAPVLGSGGPSNQGHALMTLLGQHLRALAQAFMLAVIVTNHTVGEARQLMSLAQLWTEESMHVASLAD